MFCLVGLLNEGALRSCLVTGLNGCFNDCSSLNQHYCSENKIDTFCKIEYFCIYLEKSIFVLNPSYALSLQVYKFVSKGCSPFVTY